MSGGKWTKAYAIDLAERVGSTLVYGLIALLTTTSLVDITTTTAWIIVGLPAVLSLLKGLLANLADGTTGASLAPPPYGPVVVEPPYEPKHRARVEPPA